MPSRSKATDSPAGTRSSWATLATWICATAAAASVATCSAPQGGEEEVAVVDVERPLSVVLSDAAETCAATCAHEAACADGSGAVADTAAACDSDCVANFGGGAWVDTPGARACVQAMVDELTCYSALSCDEIADYLAAPIDAEAPCASEDRQVVTRCEPYR